MLDLILLHIAYWQKPGDLPTTYNIMVLYFKVLFLRSDITALVNFHVFLWTSFLSVFWFDSFVSSDRSSYSVNVLLQYIRSAGVFLRFSLSPLRTGADSFYDSFNDILGTWPWWPCFSRMFHDVLVFKMSMMFHVLRAFLVSFCRSVPPEFLRSFLSLSLFRSSSLSSAFPS